MIMSNLQKISEIKSDALSGEFYLRSLMEEAFRHGLITESDIQRVQIDCLALLAKKSEAYHGGDSSSIRIEDAENILQSIMFTIGVALKTEDTPDDALKQLYTQYVSKIYEAGRKRIDTMLKATKQLHKMVAGNMISTKNYTYNSTLIGGINGFFKLYNPEYSAHEIHITTDYPTANPITDLAGIEFMWKYLEAIFYENMFCCKFPAENIHSMLCGYMEDYSELVINLFALVLTNAIGCVMLHKSPYGLNISKEETEYLGYHLASMARQQLTQEILLACNTMYLGMNLVLSALKEYIQRALPNITSNIFLAAKNGTLEKVFLEFD